MKILITGAAGFLGARIQEFYKEKYEVTGVFHSELDITDREAVRHFVSQHSPDVVIHCAAVSDIGECDRNPQMSWKINVEGAENAALAAAETGAKMIFCSSDQVYFKNGIKTPHKEDEEVNPPHLYGKQKLQAEKAVLSASQDHVCLRLSMMYAADCEGREEHPNFLKNILNAVNGKTQITFPVYDYRSITDVWDVVRSMERIISLPGGVYNLGSENEKSTYEVACEVGRILSCSGLIQKNEEAFQGNPRNLRMSMEKAKAAQIFLPEVSESIKENGMRLKKMLKC